MRLLDSSSAKECYKPCDMRRNRKNGAVLTMTVKELAFRVSVNTYRRIETYHFATPVSCQKLPKLYQQQTRRSKTYHNSLRSSSLMPSSRSGPLSPSPKIKPLNPVSCHSLAANASSITWNLSLTRTASPFFGLPGVVTNGNVFKNET